MRISANRNFARTKKGCSGAGPRKAGDGTSSGHEATTSTSPLDCMSPPQNEATHPRGCNEGYPDGPGRASNKEGESWVIIPRPL
jgi:hypothetical protein